MAEYIDRELAIQEMQSWDNNGFINKPTRKIPQILSEKNVPTADVIERAKVDKAIEELQNMKVYGHTRTARLVSLPEVLDVFKRNMEVENE